MNRCFKWIFPGICTSKVCGLRKKKLSTLIEIYNRKSLRYNWNRKPWTLNTVKANGFSFQFIKLHSNPTMNVIITDVIFSKQLIMECKWFYGHLSQFLSRCYENGVSYSLDTSLKGSFRPIHLISVCSNAFFDSIKTAVEIKFSIQT